MILKFTFCLVASQCNHYLSNSYSCFHNYISISVSFVCEIFLFIHSLIDILQNVFAIIYLFRHLF